MLPLVDLLEKVPAVDSATFWSRDAFQRLRSITAAQDVSPLRYPGGKRKLAVLIGQIFATSQRPVRLLVEPFAGGAAVSIALLEAGLAKEIALGDQDEMVAGFWRTVFSDQAEQLAEMVAVAEVTLAERDRVVASSPQSDVELAYKCLFINRTSFSGILNDHAGAIGGRAQCGKYKIDCRFNRARLAKRIRELSALRARVRFVRCQDYRQTITMVRGLIKNDLAAENVFWYFDPPFFEKADRLYRHFFNDEGHLAFHIALKTVPGAYVLSYDDVPAAEALYGGQPNSMAVPMVYNAAQSDCRPTKELIVSNLLTSPGAKISVHNRARFVNSRSIRKRPS